MFLIPPETPKSFKKIMHDLYKKCHDKNKKIIPEKLPEIMNAGEAAWLIMSVKCKTAYLGSSQIEEAEAIYSDIGQKYYQGAKGIEHTDFFIMDFSNQAHPNFTITKEALLQIINSEPDYANMLALKSKEVESTNSEKATPVVRAALNEWIESLIKTTSFDTYHRFEDLMLTTYFQKSPKDEIEKFNEGEKIIDVFCRLNEKKKNTVYFKIENELGNAGPLKHRALSSLKRIFDEERIKIKRSVQNIP